MIPEMKPVLCIADASTTAAATATGLVDTRPDNHYWTLALAVKLPTVAATSNKPTVLKIEECDTSNGTFTAIVALTGGTATSTSVGFVIPAGHASLAQHLLFNIDLRARKRWLKLSVSPQATQIIGANGMLGRGEQTPPISTGDLAAIVRG
jgi:hypothetical protein